MVRVLLGLILLGAAALKFQGLSAGVLPRNLLFTSPQLVLLTIEVEALLGLWLLSGLALRAAWWAGTFFFVLLAAVSLYQGVTGQESCGCFGELQVSPWWSFAIDVAAVAGLVWFRPPRSSGGAWSDRYRPFVQVGVGAVVIVALVVGIFLLVTDQPLHALARLRGEAIGVGPFVTDVGTGKPGEVRSFAVELINYTSSPVRIVGGTTSCGCVTTRDLPVELPPGGSRPIRVEMRFTGSPGRFQHRFLLYADNELQWAVVAHFAGRVSP
jgi:hypothetical protein